MFLMTLNTSNTVPKKIWMMWLQGLEQAPHLVKECYKSWKTLNPEWEVIFLDETNFRQYADVEPVLAKQKNLQRQAIADLIRAKLLAQYGGVWIDATCYCQVPLDDWLNDYTRSGFFAFRNPEKGRLLAIWFLASSQNNHLTTRWAETIDTYLLQHPQLARRSKVARYLKWFNTNTYTTRYWFSYPVKRMLKIYPYHWPSYLFTELIRSDPQSRRIWGQTRKFDADIPLKLYRSGLLAPLTEQLKEEIDSKRVPMYKLTWKPAQQLLHITDISKAPAQELDWRDGSEQYDESVLGYLFASGNTDITVSMYPTPERE